MECNARHLLPPPLAAARLHSPPRHGSQQHAVQPRGAMLWPERATSLQSCSSRPLAMAVSAQWGGAQASQAALARLRCFVARAFREGAPPISLASAVKKFQTVVPCGRLCAQRPTSTHTGGRFLPSTTGVGSRSRANLRCATERSRADRRGPQCARTCCGGAQLRPACAAVLPDANARTFHRQHVGATCAAVACCTTGGRRIACDAERCMTGVCRMQAAHHQQPVGANCCECVGESAVHNAVVAHR